MNRELPEVRSLPHPLRKPIVLSLAFFLASAFAGTLISYVPSLAWPKFTLIALGLAVFFFLSLLPVHNAVENPSTRPWASFIFAFLPTLVILYFILTNDWATQLGELPWLDPVLRALPTWQPRLPGIQMDSDAMAGVVAELLPLQVAAFVAGGKRLNWLGFILLPFSLVALFLSESRGAWIGLVSIIALWGLWVLVGFFARRRVSNRPHQAQVAITITILVLVTLAGIAAALTPFGQSLLQRRNDRLMVWQNSFDLASDYSFTGLGLGGFEMAYSSYVLLLHVGHTAQAHDLYLDVWIEQGLIGLVALAGLIFFSIQPIVSSLAHARPLSRWQVASFAALGVTLVHGILDDPYYGYGGIAIPFLFIPFALIARHEAWEETRLGTNPLRAAPILGGTLLVVLIAALLPATRSAFTANMGALVQTRSELSVYSWPAWPIQDQVRRSLRTDLSPGIELYQSALVIDAQDVTANRRLGQIELSLGQYEKAQQHLLAAYKSAPSQRATRQMLGELYAISGDSTRAATLWSGIDLSDGQLGIREWWYEHIAEPEHAASIKSVEIAGR